METDRDTKMQQIVVSRQIQFIIVEPSLDPQMVIWWQAFCTVMGSFVSEQSGCLPMPARPEANTGVQNPSDVPASREAMAPPISALPVNGRSPSKEPRPLEFLPRRAPLPLTGPRFGLNTLEDAHEPLCVDGDEDGQSIAPMVVTAGATPVGKAAATTEMPFGAAVAEHKALMKQIVWTAPSSGMRHRIRAASVEATAAGDAGSSLAVHHTTAADFTQQIHSRFQLQRVAVLRAKATSTSHEAAVVAATEAQEQAARDAEAKTPETAEVQEPKQQKRQQLQPREIL